VQKPLTEADFPVKIAGHLRELVGWPSWEAVMAGLGPEPPGVDPWYDTTGWDPQFELAQDVRLWWVRGTVRWGRIYVTPRLCRTAVTVATGPAQEALLEALLLGLGDDLPW